MPAPTKIRFLWLAYSFPPVRKTASRRFWGLFRQLAPQVERVEVITAESSLRMAQEPEQQLPGSPHYVPGKDLRSYYGDSTTTPTQLHLPRQRGTLTGELLRWRQAWPLVYLSDDGGATYRKNAYHKAVQLIHDHRITHLFSSFRPWSDHLIAGRLKKDFPHLHWTADFRDLPIDPVRNDLAWPAAQRSFLRNTLRQADLITAVSEGQAAQFRKLRVDAHVLRNGLVQLPPPFPTIAQDPFFTIRYTGTIYPALHDPGLLFRSLRGLLDSGHINPFYLRLEYIGNQQTTWRRWAQAYGLAHLSKEQSFVALNELKAIQRNSQILLLMNWSGPDYYGVLNAKLYDYLEAGRPILALVNGPDDPELRRIVEGSQAGRVFDQTATVEAVADWLLDLYQTWTFTGGLPWLSNRAELEQYLWQAQVSTYLKWIAG